MRQGYDCERVLQYFGDSENPFLNPFIERPSFKISSTDKLKSFFNILKAIQSEEIEHPFTFPFLVCDIYILRANMAGPQGFEPWSTVLETGILPLYYRPI